MMNWKECENKTVGAYFKTLSQHLLAETDVVGVLTCKPPWSIFSVVIEQADETSFIEDLLHIKKDCAGTEFSVAYINLPHKKNVVYIDKTRRNNLGWTFPSERFI